MPQFENFRHQTRVHRSLGFMWAALAAVALVAGCGSAPQVVEDPVIEAPKEGTIRTGTLGGFWKTVPVPPRVIDAPFLWRIEGEKGPVFLFGTIHLGVDARAELPPVVWDSLAASDTYVMEADISKVDSLKVMSYARLPAGQSLSGMLEPEVWTGVKKLLGMLPEPMLDQSKPWFINIALIQLSFPPAPPMDKTLMDDARAKGKNVAFLEGWEEQIQMLDGLPHAYSVGSISEAVKEPEKLKAEVQLLLDSYRGGDEAEIARVVLENEELVKYPAVIEAMFRVRNQRWVPQIEAYTKTGKVFIATGLGHLVGEDSVIALLRKKGYKVVRVQ